MRILDNDGRENGITGRIWCYGLLDNYTKYDRHSFMKMNKIWQAESFYFFFSPFPSSILFFIYTFFSSLSTFSTYECITANNLLQLIHFHSLVQGSTLKDKSGHYNNKKAVLRPIDEYQPRAIVLDIFFNPNSDSLATSSSEAMLNFDMIVKSIKQISETVWIVWCSNGYLLERWTQGFLLEAYQHSLWPTNRSVLNQWYSEQGWYA